MDDASNAAKLFFPHSQALGIAPDDTFSPAVLRKVVYAGSHASSFQQAGKDLKEEAEVEVEVSEQRIMRATKRIGRERTEQRDAAVDAWGKLPLPERQCSPRPQVPQVACVEADGGRLQIRDRKATEEEHQATKRAGFWREDKVGCLLSMTSTVSQEDPCPEIPRVFVDPRRIWPIYCQWAQWTWSGQVHLVIEALRARQKELGLPEKDESEETPRSKVATALRYLANQQSRMHYDQYRREGLPITSSHIESTIKQINRRVKGTEKFWSEGGAEALLQLGADYLSDTDPMPVFWRDRPNHATGQRQYNTTG